MDWLCCAHAEKAGDNDGSRLGVTYKGRVMSG